MNVLFWVYLAGCKSDFECPLTQACIQKECQNPCIYEQCGIEAICEVRTHQAKCVCPPSYLGDPYQVCRKPECIVDDDCPQVLACENEKCVDPCACAVNANCIVRSHRARCQCITSYIGDPYNTGCYPGRNNFFVFYSKQPRFKPIIIFISNKTKEYMPMNIIYLPLFLALLVKVHLAILLFSVPEPDIAEPECRVDSDCPSRLACLNEHCQNPCTTLSPCGVNAECTVQNTLPQRTMICMCLPGYVGDANTLCSLRKILFTLFFF